MKIAIIGGGGRVGSNAAFALQLRGLGREIVLLDVNAEAAAGEALDLLHGTALCGPQVIRAGGWDDLAGADLVIVTAGLRRQPDESRLALTNRNVALFRDILAQLARLRLASHGHLFVVSNPVDVLTALAVRETGFDPHRIYGLGTVLDTLRLRSLLAVEVGADPTQVQALVLGEHGDSQVPLWSSAAINGVALESWPGVTERLLDTVAARTRGSGAEVISLKGGAGYAVGVAIAEVVAAVAGDRGCLLPISTLQDGLLGVRDICYSVPTILGREGWTSHVLPRLWPREEQALVGSAAVLRATLAEVLG